MLARVGLVLTLISPAFAQAPAPAAVFTRYCLTCHSAALKTAGLALDPADLTRIDANPEQWEKVVRKLRTNAMPPAGAPRPDQATYDSVASFLETELDRAAAAHPNPGKLPLLHRLSRTEYQNAIRDLLSLDALPKEMDYTLLLPPDNSSSGFDNIADLLFVSPTIMERYLDAARKISRLAVGDPSAPVMVNSYRLSPEQTQDTRVDSLPFGTRGGLGVRTDFPLDGEYSIKLDLSGAEAGSTRNQRHDGERVQLKVNIGGAGRGRPEGADKPLELRIPVKAGPRLLGVSFVQRTEARDEATLRPRMRGRGSQTALVNVTISGPYNATGPGDTPSRNRIFVCRPKALAEEVPCAKQNSLHAGAAGLPASRHRCRPQRSHALLRRRPLESGFDTGIPEGPGTRLLVSPQFLFRIEPRPRRPHSRQRPRNSVSHQRY